ncbi:MAG: sulfurtransferase [Cryomorphaceae bacterium]
MITTLLTASEVMSMMGDPNVIVLDATFGKTAYPDYCFEHLIGAQWIDLNSQLSEIGPEPSKGGRHPLPSVSSFATVLGELGVGVDSKVIVYDKHSGALAAARCWWMLHAIGHPQTWVVDGGFQALKQAGAPTDSEIIKPRALPPYPSSEWKLPTKTMTEIEGLDPNDSTLVDVRESERYQGIREPIDLTAGHIPNAVNIPFSHNLNADGSFKTREELKKIYADVLRMDKNVIFYCGSGVTACHGILGLAHASNKMAALYPGSWSEWSRNPH